MAKTHFEMSCVNLLLITLLSVLEVTLGSHSALPFPSPHKCSTSQLDPTTPNIWSNQPKCRSANAQVYFLPTAPKPAKVTVLREPTNVAKPAEPEVLQKTIDINTNIPKLGVPPPPPSSAVLPGVLDKIPTIIPPVEETCPCLNRKSRILEEIFERTSKVLPNAFNYDQDLLDGFLSSLGL